MQNKDDKDIINEDIKENEDISVKPEEEVTVAEEKTENINEEDFTGDYDENYQDYSESEPDDEYYEEEYHEPVRSEVPKKKKKKRKKKRSRLPGVIILTTFIFAVSVCLSLVIIAFGRDMLGIGKSENTHLIVIPEGATTEEISILLKDEGIIKSPECFQLFSRLRKSDSLYIAGEHFVRPNMAYETIINELTSMDEEKEQETIEVTFPEGSTLFESAYILEDNGVCSADDFIFYFNSGGLGFDFENKLPTDASLKFYRMEGYLFPDTYFFYENMSPEQVCQKIYLNFDNKMTDERYARMESLGLSLDQLITFASIVQKEAANTDTMTLVASVFWNRLRNSAHLPLLQSDPTSNY
ncbi:MAG: endolytic transglycosylase MltG, partial [Ruminococcus sp.]|nr:endolytic transglycosylase MltG [Ruminococcus sp.]